MSKLINLFLIFYTFFINRHTIVGVPQKVDSAVLFLMVQIDKLNSKYILHMRK